MPDAHVAHPLGAPTVSGTTITVETMLNQPTRVTRMIMDLTLQRFILDKIFSNAGSVSGGSVIYDQATLNELYTTRDVEIVAPGAEFPIITSERKVPNVATVDKWGGKVFITDEARDRNNYVAFANQIRQLSNTIVRKLNAIAIQTLVDSITASGQTMTGVDWSAVITAGTSATSAEEMPMRDFVQAQANADVVELGVNYDLFLLSPSDNALLTQIYGAEGAKTLLNQLGVSVFVSNQVPDGTMYAIATGQTGEYRLEKALSTETWREPEKEQTWVQSSVRPVFYVTNPYSVLEVTGIS